MPRRTRRANPQPDLQCPPMNASDIRSTFLNYFESKGHQIVASSPVEIGRAHV